MWPCIALSAVSLVLPSVPQPPAIVQPAVARAAVGTSTSTYIAAAAAAFPDGKPKVDIPKVDTSGLQKAISENAPVIQQKLQTEVAPALQKGLEQVVAATNEELKLAAPVVEKTAKDLAPVAQEALDVVGPVVVQGAQAAGAGLFRFATSAAVTIGKGALELGTQAAQVAATEAGSALDKALSENVDENTKSTIKTGGNELVKAAAPVVDEGIRQASPYVEKALGQASRVGAKVLKDTLASVSKELDAFTDDAPAPAKAAPPVESVNDAIAAAEAERAALLAKMGQ
jgi:hypothetical protein